jgi:hypothetical protein
MELDLEEMMDFTIIKAELMADRGEPAIKYKGVTIDRFFIKFVFSLPSEEHYIDVANLIRRAYKIHREKRGL